MRRAQGSSLLKVLTVAVASAVGIFLSGSHFAVEGQASASLIGIVLQEGSDQPLPGATLMILETQRSVVTDDNGEFSFLELTPGEVVLRAGLDGYASVVESLEIASNEVGFVQLRLPPLFAALDEIFVIAEESSVEPATRKRRSKTTMAILGLQRTSSKGRCSDWIFGETRVWQVAEREFSCAARAPCP